MAILAGVLLAMPGCRIPELQKPDCGVAMPDGYNGAAAQTIDGTVTPDNTRPAPENELISWENSAQISRCDFFEDPALKALIDEAMVYNQELKILAQDIQIANNEVLGRRGLLWPLFSLGAGAGIEKPSVFSREGAVEENLEAAPGIGFPSPLPKFMVASNISWEIDIWRRLRNARDAATLRYLGTAEGRNYVVTRLVADIAENYYDLLALDNRLINLDQTIAIQEQSLQYTESMKMAGRETELPVQRFTAEVRKNQSERFIIQQEIVEVENEINTLVGRFPQPVERSQVDYINLHLHALSAGVPSQLLQNRPDIRQAEREVQASGLDVRVARAAFYPSLVLSAGVGYEAFNTKYLFRSPDSLVYSVGGDLVAPIINRAAIKADYQSANARQLQAIYEYQQTVINAFTEVVNRMNRSENYAQSVEIKKRQIDALVSSVDNANRLFQADQIEYIEVLLAQREMMEARMVLINTKREQLDAVVNAYQALGGGAF